MIQSHMMKIVSNKLIKNNDEVLTNEIQKWFEGFEHVK